MEANREQGLGVWQFGYDCMDWVVADSEEAAIACYEGTTGVTKEEYEEVKEVCDLDKLHFVDPEDVTGYNEKGYPIYRRYTARKAIQDLLSEGGSAPCVIASTEY